MMQEIKRITNRPLWAHLSQDDSGKAGSSGEEDGAAHGGSAGSDAGNRGLGDGAVVGLAGPRASGDGDDGGARDVNGLVDDGGDDGGDGGRDGLDRLAGPALVNGLGGGDLGRPRALLAGDGLGGLEGPRASAGGGAVLAGPRAPGATADGNVGLNGADGGGDGDGLGDDLGGVVRAVGDGLGAVLDGVGGGAVDGRRGVGDHGAGHDGGAGRAVGDSGAARGDGDNVGRVDGAVNGRGGDRGLERGGGHGGTGNDGGGGETHLEGIESELYGNEKGVLVGLVERVTEAESLGYCFKEWTTEVK